MMSPLCSARRPGALPVQSLRGLGFRNSSSRRQFGFVAPRFVSLTRRGTRRGLISAQPDADGCASSRLRSPTPLFFAIAAVLHAAPPPPMRLACIDEIDLAVGCAALSDPSVIGRDKQGFDRERAGVQRNFWRGWRDPAVPDRV